MNRIDYQAAQRVREKLSLTDLCTTGFFFCGSCQKVTQKTDTEPSKCVRCGSFRVKWCPAVEGMSDPVVPPPNEQK